MPNVVLSPTGTTLNKQFEFEKKSKPLLFYFKSSENFGKHLVCFFIFYFLFASLSMLILYDLYFDVIDDVGDEHVGDFDTFSPGCTISCFFLRRRWTWRTWRQWTVPLSLD